MPNAGGMVPPAPGYLRGLRRLADQFGVLLLFDEIVTFRLSSGGLQEAEDALPDMTALAKIIGGGFPVGAFGGRADIMAQFSPAAGADYPIPQRYIQWQQHHHDRRHRHDESAESSDD